MGGGRLTESGGGESEIFVNIVRGEGSVWLKGA